MRHLTVFHRLDISLRSGHCTEMAIPKYHLPLWGCIEVAIVVVVVVDASKSIIE